MKKHRTGYTGLLGWLVVVALIHHVVPPHKLRIDLTADQRYSMHAATKDLLRSLPGEITITLYLAGDLPAGFQQLQRATKRLLAECNVYAKGKLHPQWIDPTHVEKKQELYQHLVDKGIQPTNLFVQEKGKRTEKLIFPGAILAGNGQEIGIMLLKGNTLMPPAHMLHQSIENIEYEFAKALNQLTNKAQKKIALLTGHGEPPDNQLQGLKKALAAQYTLHEIPCTAAIMHYDALLLVKPQKAFTELEKYQLDQYIMQGGSILFFLDRLQIHTPSVGQGHLALPLNLNLADQLFRYGVRINPDIIEDLHAGLYPIVVGKLGNQPQIQLLPWPVLPILHNFADHLITHNIDVLYTPFISSIDALPTAGVTHTPLIYTSPYTRKLDAPVPIQVETLRNPPPQDAYTAGAFPIAYLLAGTFPSLYTNRPLPPGASASDFRATSKPTQLLVVSSSYMVTTLHPPTKQPLPWGYDPFMKKQFANEDFVMNALAYMLHEQGLINAKHKKLQLYILNKTKIEKNRLAWQLLNVAGPLLALLLIGGGWTLRYRSKYRRR